MPTSVEHVPAMIYDHMVSKSLKLPNLQFKNKAGTHLEYLLVRNKRLNLVMQSNQQSKHY